MKKLEFKKTTNIFEICKKLAISSLEINGKKVSATSINLHAKRYKKALTKGMKQNDKAFLYVMRCADTGEELGSYFCSVSGIDSRLNFLNKVYVEPEHRHENYFTELVNHFEENHQGIKLVETLPEEVDLYKELYAQWGYTKSAANLMPNSWVLVKERDIAALQMICDSVGKAYAA